MSCSDFWTKHGPQWFSGNIFLPPFPFSMCNRVNEASSRCCMGLLCGWCSSSEVPLFFCNTICHCFKSAAVATSMRPSRCGRFQASYLGSFSKHLGAAASGTSGGSLLHFTASLWRVFVSSYRQTSLRHLLRNSYDELLMHFDFS